MLLYRGANENTGCSLWSIICKSTREKLQLPRWDSQMCAASDSAAGLSLEKTVFLLTLDLIMMKTTYCHFTKQLFLSTRTRIIHDL